MVAERRVRAANAVRRSAALAVLSALLLVSAAGAQPGRTEQQSGAYLGILLGLVDQGGRGISVREVTPDSPADKAGLRAGDQIVKAEDRDVQNVEQFLQSVAARKPGDKLTLQVMHAGQEKTLTVTLGERPATGGPMQAGAPGFPAFPGLTGGRRPAFLGVQTQPLTPEVKQRLKVQADAGVVVTEVVPNSPAAKAGLKPDDVITAINDKAVHDPAQLREVVQQFGPDQDVTIHVQRGGQNQSLQAKLGEAGLGMFLTPGAERFPTLDVESMVDQARRLRELEHRVTELEKRIRDLEKKGPPQS